MPVFYPRPHIQLLISFKFLLIFTLMLNPWTITANPDLRSILSRPENRWSLSTKIFYPSDPKWTNETTQRWSMYRAPSYDASIRPGMEEDVVKIVKLSKAENISFLTTAGGHGYSITLGGLRHGLELDLAHFNSVHVRKEEGVLTVGGAATFDRIIDPVFDAGFETVQGSCLYMGMVGATLNGGVGRYQGLHGLIGDSLISLRMVTAEGDVITVSAHEHPDLFWGLRGAGSNFGVILEATYRLHDQTNGGYLLNADLVFPASANQSFFETLATYQDRLPPELSLFTLIDYNMTNGGPVVILNAIYAGPEEEGKALIKPFLDLQPVTETFTVTTWNKLIPTSGFGLDYVFSVKGNVHSSYIVSARNISAPTLSDTFDKFAEFYEKFPDAKGSSVEVQFYPNQVVKAVPEHATAYAWRDVQAQIQLSMTWTNESLAGEVDAFADRLRSELITTAGYPDFQVYVGYSHGDEPIESIYGKKKLPQLAKLKKRWDPANIFGWNHALPTSYP